MDELNAFEDEFYNDLESWFSADIACCDECVGDFISTWPHAYTADDYEFQKSSISLEAFYLGSRLRQTYSLSEFNKLVHQLICPRCGSYLQANIWPYVLPFDVPDYFEKTIQEINEIATNTPFLLLNHSFCKKVYSVIKCLFEVSKEENIKKSLFRGRIIGQKKLKNDISTFDFPPADKVLEGRFNHAGNPVLYLASDLETCKAELRNKNSLISEFKYTASIRILDLKDPFDFGVKESDLLSCLAYSSLVSTKHDDEGHFKPHYVISRFTADCAREIGFTAIRYPSTRHAGNSYNLVILDQNLSLKSNTIVNKITEYK